MTLFEKAFRPLGLHKKTAKNQKSASLVSRENGLNAYELEERIVLTGVPIDVPTAEAPETPATAPTQEYHNPQDGSENQDNGAEADRAIRDDGAAILFATPDSEMAEGSDPADDSTTLLEPNTTTEITESGTVVPTGQRVIIASSGSNTSPVITSDGGGATASVNIDEGETTVTGVTATDADFDTVTYSITGGADQALFSIDSLTGVLTFNSAPDFEQQGDADMDNAYEVQITASDGNGGSDVQDITVNVQDVSGLADASTFDAANGALDFQNGVLSSGTALTAGAVYTYTDIINIGGEQIDATFTIVSISGNATLTSADSDSSVVSALTPEIRGTGSGGGQVDFRVNFFDSNGDEILLTNFVINSIDIDGPEFVEFGGFSALELNGTTDLLITEADNDRIRISSNGAGYNNLSTTDVGRVQAIFANAVHSFEISMGVNSDTGSASRLFGTTFSTSSFSDPVSLTAPTVVSQTTSDTTPTLTGSIGSLVLGAGESVSVTVDGVTYTNGDGNLSVSSLTWTLNIPSGNEIAAGTYDVTVVRDYSSIGNDNATREFQDQTTNELTVEVNNAPTIISNGGGDTASLSREENDTSVTTVIGSDIDPGDELTYSITGGADQSAFSIDASSGALTFNSAPNFESPADSDTDNVYVVAVTVTDIAGLTDTQTLTITITDANEPPVITSNGGGDTAGVTIPENTSAVTTVTATDPDMDTPTFSITGGDDSSAFTIDTVTGVLAFSSAPNYDAPTDTGMNNTYVVEVTADDGNGGTDVQTLTVTVTDVNEPPVITSDGGGSTASVSIPEDTSSVTTVTATDDDGDTPTFTITGGADSGLLSIDSTTGALTFDTAPDFENPADSDMGNDYVVEVTASDGKGGTDIQTLTITITDTNLPPVITSNGGGTTASVTIPEDTTAVTTVVATDADNDTPTYTITGGADSALLSIDSTTGALTFNSAPDFENPTDSNADNDYIVEVTADDGNSGTDVQTLTITISDQNIPPVINSNGGGATASIDVEEGNTGVTTVSATDADMDVPTYTITGGADSASFSLDSTSGVLAFTSAPDYDTPTDSDSNNSYVLEVTASDGKGGTDVQTITVNVTPDNVPPVITSNGGGTTASVSVPEGNTSVTTVTATDGDGDTRTYTITGGADSASFTLDSLSGVLVFNSAPDFEAPTDSNTDNDYVLEVTVSDGNGGSDVQTITVTVTDENAPPVITSDGGGTTATVNITEGTTSVTTVTATDPDLDTPTYTITGGADSAQLSIDSVTGALTFDTAPDYENPTDANANNSYIVEVTANDGNGGLDVQTLTINVSNQNEGPDLTTPSLVTVAEGHTGTVFTVTASDPDSTGLTYSIIGGDDADDFTINSQTGAVSFLTSPDADNPTDLNENSSYAIRVRVSDGVIDMDQDVTIRVSNQAPNITTSGVQEIVENTTEVVTLTATDPLDNAPSWSITGGADADLFTVDSVSGALSFISAPDFENPADSNSDNRYSVIVTATDANGATDAQSITVTVTNEPEAPVITSDGGGDSAEITVDEGTQPVTTVMVSDDSGDASFTISGGVDADAFTIDATTGALSFIAAPDFENPTDSDTNNIYLLEVTATTSGGADTQTITVNVLNVNEAPIITSDGGGETADLDVNEGETGVTTVTATDADGDEPTFSITGGPDASAFTIDSVSGALTLNALPDYENPADSDGNNVYTIQVTADDGNGGTDVQTLNISIVNDNDAPTITSPDQATVLEGNTEALTVTADDPDGDDLSFSIVGGDDAANFTIDGNGVLRFASAPDADSATDEDGNNIYAVTVAVSDGEFTAEQNITLIVTNVAPEITSGTSIQAAENESFETILTATDPVDNAPSWSISGGADADLFNINAETGELSLSIIPDFENPDDSDANNSYVVDVTATDANGATDTQTLTLTITNENEPFTATPIDLGETPEEVGVTFTNDDLLAGSNDPDGDPLTIVSVTLDDPSLGELIVNDDGSYTFIPATDYNGPVTFSFSVTDGEETLETRANLLVTPVNDAPIVEDIDLGTTPEEVGVTFTNDDLLAGSSDPDGDPLTVISVTLDDPSLGELIINDDGSYTFIPATDYNGPVTFSFEVSDGTETVEGDANLLVTPVNDLPNVEDIDLGEVLETDELGFTDDDLLVGASDPEGDPLTVVSVTLDDPSAGELIDNGDGSYTFVPSDVNDDETVSVTFVVSDGTDEVSGSGTILVINVPPPVVAPDQVATDPQVAPPTNTPATNAPAGDTGGDSAGGGAPQQTTPNINTDGNVVEAVNSPFDSVEIELFVEAGIPDYFTEVESEFEFGIPDDAFANRETDGDSQILEIASVEATLADGSPLPDWIQFESDTMTFRGVMPAAIGGDLVIKVKVVDAAGNEADTTFRIIKGGDPTNDEAVQPEDGESGDTSNGNSSNVSGETGSSDQEDSSTANTSNKTNQNSAANGNIAAFGSHKFFKDTASLLDII